MLSTQTVLPRLLKLFAVLIAFASYPLSAQEQATDAAPSLALQQLVDVLRDDDARAALIQELERLSAQESSATTPSEIPAEEASVDPQPEENAAPATPSEELRSLGGRIADVTREVAHDTAASITRLLEQLARAPTILGGIKRVTPSQILDVITDLTALIAITYGGLIVLRLLMANVRETLSGAFANGGWIARPLTFALLLLADFVAIVFPWGLGYGVALSLLGSPGEISFPHSLYLNAFLMTEVTIAIIRRIVSPQKPIQRLIGVSSRRAWRVMIWSRAIVSLFVYGQLLFLPLFNRTISYAAGRAVSVVLILLVLLMTVAAVVLARGAVAGMILRSFKKPQTRKTLRPLVTLWHVPVLIYLLALAILAATRSPTVFQDILWTNGQIALAVLVGIIASNILGRMIGKGVHLPDTVRQHTPLLESRVNALVPVALRLLRFAVVIGIVIFCLHMLGVIDFPAYLESGFGGRVAGATITVTLIVFFAFALWLVLNAWVERRINPEARKKITSRERTLLVLLHNALTIAIIVVTLMVVLSELGLNIGPLLASAGVIGLAIGFGAQKLVQDIITGIFIQLEGAIDVGDVVSVAGISGVVERLTIRSVSLRDSEGSYHVVPFSTVAAVTNYMRGHSFALVDVTVPYLEDMEKVKDAMFAAFDRLKADPAHARNIIGSLDWNGVNSFNLTETVVRARVKTAPGKQWGAKRAYNLYLKEEFLSRFIGVKPADRPKIKEMEKAEDPKEQAEPKRKQANEDIDLPDPDSGPDSRA